MDHNQYQPSQPTTSDYYADLGIQINASSQEVKAAFFRLAKEHHPDKKAPGESIDAKEFRKIHEAYECLRNWERRSAYDAGYFHLCNQWQNYRRWKEYEAEERRRRAEALRRHADAERRAARAREAQRKEEQEKRAARAAAEHKRYREEQARQAEERSREAGRRARLYQEQAAQERLERLRREAERRAEIRSERAAKRARADQERAALERLKGLLTEEAREAGRQREEALRLKREEVLRQNWTGLRRAGERKESMPRSKPTSTSPLNMAGCVHMEFGWPKKKGKATCAVCGEVRQKWFFCCPQCLVPACPSCKARHSMF